MNADSLSLIWALLAFLPIVLAAIGYFGLARLLARNDEVIGEMAFTSALLILAGLLGQAVWQLLLVTSRTDINWLRGLQWAVFPPGFLFLTWALWRARTRATEKLTAGSVWLLPLFINVLILGGSLVVNLMRGGRARLMMLATATAIGIVLTAAQLVHRAQKQRRWSIQILFALAFVTFLLLTGTSRLPQPMIQQPWLFILLGTLAQAAFVLAVSRLAAAEQTR